MKRTKMIFLGLAAVAGLAMLGRGGRAVAPVLPVLSRAQGPVQAEGWHRPVVDGPRIQIALLLDTSGSMDGLINQARTELWHTVTELTHARQDGRRPTVELALYAYGLAAHEETGYIQQIAPFTDELDRLSEALFALTTTGSEEYCGQVIRTATRQLDWSTKPNDLRLIFIAGNESFAQGPVPPIEAVKEAQKKGITVNTIHCGPEDAEIIDGWRQASLAGEGRFAQIDHDRAVVEVAAPQDAEIGKLNAQLNQTYVGYGANGSVGQARQAAQDTNYENLSLASLSQRAVVKADARAYDNSGWDLVDARRSKTVDVSKMDDADLPPELRGKSAAERSAWLEAKQAERTRLQTRIRELGDERAKFVASHQEPADDTSLDRAMLATVHEEAARVRFKFE